MKSMNLILGVGVCCLILSCCSSYENLNTVPTVDLQRYSGTWYEIARLPNSFEKGLKCISATYTIRTDGRIDVLNKGTKISEPSVVKTATGIAWVPDPAFPARLKVRFFWPFSGNYYIMDLDTEGYQYALIGDPSRGYLWVLSRTPQMPADIYDRLISVAKTAGFDTGQVIKVEHDCSN